MTTGRKNKHSELFHIPFLPWAPIDFSAERRLVACVAGVQREGRGEVECEREARSLGAYFALSLRFALAFNFPPPSPLYAGHAG